MLTATCTLSGTAISSSLVNSKPEVELEDWLTKAAVHLKARYPDELTKMQTLTGIFATFLVLRLFESENAYFNEQKEGTRDRLVELLTEDIEDDSEDEETELDDSDFDLPTSYIEAALEKWNKGNKTEANLFDCLHKQREEYEKVTSSTEEKGDN